MQFTCIYMSKYADKICKYMSKYELDMHKYVKYAKNMHKYATKICTICRNM